MGEFSDIYEHRGLKLHSTTGNVVIASLFYLKSVVVVVQSFYHSRKRLPIMQRSHGSRAQKRRCRHNDSPSPLLGCEVYQPVIVLGSKHTLRFVTKEIDTLAANRLAARTIIKTTKYGFKVI